MEVTVRRKLPGRIERKLVGKMVRNVLGWNPPPRTQPILTQLPWEPFTFEGNTGARIAARWFGIDDPRGTFVLAHPDRRAAQQWFLPKGYIEFLQDAGYDVMTFDFAGYGDSRGGSTYLVEDLIAAHRAARARTRGPVHVLGVSIGAFQAANAAPYLDGLGALILESPFPTFNAWYGRGWGRWSMSVFDLVFPKTSALIQAHKNIAHAKAKKILIVAADGDRVTPVELSEHVMESAPAGRSEFLRLNGHDHLTLFETSPVYRQRILDVLEEATSHR